MILRCLLALFFSSIIVLSPSCSHAEAQEQPPSASPELSLVPWPQSIQCAHGSFTLDQTARIVAEHLSLLGLANVLAKELRSTCSVELTNTSDAARTGDIPPRLSDNLEDECNIVKINHMASIEGGNYEAVALGTVTLLQLLERNGSVVTSPRLTIEDGRKSAYRGLLVDVARNCHSVDTLRQCVELCRMYKVRYLQLHVSDDQGFTFPSTGYPQLTSMNWHGGPAYTLDELKELEAYASARGIAIVPEFEVPGHAGTMNRSMPEHRRGLSRPHRYTDLYQWKPADEPREPLHVINTGQTENGFFVVQITANRICLGYRAMMNVQVIRQPERTERREWDGTWGWRFLHSRELKH